MGTNHEIGNNLRLAGVGKTRPARPLTCEGGRLK